MPESLQAGDLAPLLEVTDLHVYYGHAHALQGINLALSDGVLAVVGRNGMGKSTLCNTIIGLTPAASGSVKMSGVELLGLAPNRVVAQGIAYVPQGRRIWPSLTVDEHLRLAVSAGKAGGGWTIARVYEVFPRLAERKRHGGAQLSGGEQQMLAISRAMLANPTLLVMDEPTEGLAPVIVDQLSDMLRGLAREGEIAVLLIEQNLGVATSVADRVAVMVNGRLVHNMSARELAADTALQQRLLGVGAQNEDEEAAEAGAGRPAVEEREAQVFRVRRAWATPAEPIAETDPGQAARATPTQWSHHNPLLHSSTAERHVSKVIASPAAAEQRPRALATVDAIQVPVSTLVGRTAYIAGTYDTKGRELGYMRSLLDQLGLRTTSVDLSTSQRPSPADIGPGEVARFHPRGRQAVFTGDRGSSVSAMAEAFACFIQSRRDLAGIVSGGGSGGTALVTPAMQALPIGVPKVMVSTVASGDVKAYVGPADICMMYSVTDVSGINRISERVLANAAHALAGMVAHSRKPSSDAKPAVGLTMFGVTTPCVQAVARALEERFDCLVFHATGTGGQSMEKLVDSGLLAGVLDVTTTEVCDLHMGGVFSAGEDRFGAVIRSGVPYVGSCGALDMVNWGPIDTVPERFRQRNLYPHNPQVTLMRTTVEENDRMGRWIGERLNRMQGPVRFLIPEGGVSLLDRPGQAFYDPEADAALFRALEETVEQSHDRRLLRLPLNLNDPPFAEALVESFLKIMKSTC